LSKRVTIQTDPVVEDWRKPAEFQVRQASATGVAKV
jgi:hypothetical protein